ncbi:unnamed protein product [Parnassius apollo]|uniref:(apollo) hypothetical protein n=1 Tax=Parnassius apollo TaxID=110799 RepID=A0A8S3WW52_PARAO|nr:unnamed protein product [Parnassius apollo]
MIHKHFKAVKLFLFRLEFKKPCHQGTCRSGTVPVQSYVVYPPCRSGLRRTLTFISLRLAPGFAPSSF